MVPRAAWYHRAARVLATPLLPHMDHVTLHRSAAAATRLAAAHEFLDALSPAAEAIVVGATRDAADDLVRD